MRKVAFYTLGCKVNSYETEAVWELFSQRGYSKVDFKDEADVYVINTCTVTNNSDSKSRKVIRQAIRRNPNAVIAVMGCYAQVATNEIMDIDGVDIVIGTKGREQVVDLVENYLNDRVSVSLVSDIMKESTFESLAVSKFSENTRAFLKIQEGCNNFCTYCIIPYARGGIRSRVKEDVITQIKNLVNNGYKEVVLAGIHTASYGVDFENYSFAELLQDIITEVPSLERLRISSIEASEITDEVIEVLKNSKVFANHLHIPLQSGSNTVLKRMNRKYTTNEFKQKIDLIRSIFPGIAITTDVIVGFPCETDEEFRETYNFIKEVAFSELHVFPYSKRNGTPAAKMKEQVPEFIKTLRVSELIGLNESLATEYAKSFEGQLLDVIVETRVDGRLEGHSSNYLKILFDGDDSLLRKLVTVKLTNGGYPYSTGEIV